MMSVQEWTNDVQLCVTFGAANVAKYQFLCREPFTIDGTTFFSDGVTEEEHIAAILGEGIHHKCKIKCSIHVYNVCFF